jgi:hypothetical protein
MGYCNHSCVPNSVATITDGLTVITALSEVAKDEELTICYCDECPVPALAPCPLPRPHPTHTHAARLWHQRPTSARTHPRQVRGTPRDARTQQTAPFHHRMRACLSTGGTHGIGCVRGCRSAPLQERRAVLRDHYGFECRCGRCQQETRAELKQRVQAARTYSRNHAS